MAKEILTKGEAMADGGAHLADVRMNESGDLRMALARAVAGRKVPDDAIPSVAKKLAQSDLGGHVGNARVSRRDAARGAAPVR